MRRYFFSSSAAKSITDEEVIFWIFSIKLSFEGFFCFQYISSEKHLSREVAEKIEKGIK
jgi:hypothetical protein